MAIVNLSGEVMMYCSALVSQLVVDTYSTDKLEEMKVVLYIAV